MKYIVTYLAVFVLFTAVVFGGIQLDLLLNPWIKEAVEEWHWYNYLTTQHAITGLYLMGWFWLIPSFVFSLIASFALIVSKR